MNTNPTPDRELADRLRTLYAEVAALWGFTTPKGPLDGISAAALEAMMRAVKEDRESAATRLEALQAQLVGEAGRLRESVENAIAGIEAGNLYEPICCGGGGQNPENYCGCRGSSNADLLIYHLREALTASPPVVEREAELVAIEGDQIVIRVPIDALPQACAIAWDSSLGEHGISITDLPVFAKEFVLELKREQENGDTLVHKMLDRAAYMAVNNGAEGLSE